MGQHGKGTAHGQRKARRVAKDLANPRGKSAGAISTLSSLPVGTLSALIEGANVKDPISIVVAPKAVVSKSLTVSKNARRAERTVPIYKDSVNTSTGPSGAISVSPTKPDICPAAPAEVSVAKDSIGIVEGMSGEVSASTTSCEITPPAPAVPDLEFSKGTGTEPHILDCTAVDRIYKASFRNGGDDSEPTYNDQYWVWYKLQNANPAPATALPLMRAEARIKAGLFSAVRKKHAALAKVVSQFESMEYEEMESAEDELARLGRLTSKYLAAFDRPSYYIIRLDGCQFEVVDDGGDLADEDEVYWPDGEVAFKSWNF